MGGAWGGRGATGGAAGRPVGGGVRVPGLVVAWWLTWRARPWPGAGLAARPPGRWRARPWPGGGLVADLAARPWPGAGVATWLRSTEVLLLLRPWAGLVAARPPGRWRARPWPGGGLVADLAAWWRRGWWWRSTKVLVLLLSYVFSFFFLLFFWWWPGG